MDINRHIEVLAEQIAVAAKTAPKARGTDNLLIKIIRGKDIPILSDMMIRTSKDMVNADTFKRDAQNILSAGAVILFAAKNIFLGLDCGFCGFENCGICGNSGAVCAYVPGDLGIAIGSAVSRAADLRLDNRIMYTVGYTAQKQDLFEEKVALAFGLPLSASSKNPFFDRK